MREEPAKGVPHRLLERPGRVAELPPRLRGVEERVAPRPAHELARDGRAAAAETCRELGQCGAREHERVRNTARHRDAAQARDDPGHLSELDVVPADDVGLAVAPPLQRLGMGACRVAHVAVRPAAAHVGRDRPARQHEQRAGARVVDVSGAENHAWPQDHEREPGPGKLERRLLPAVLRDEVVHGHRLRGADPVLVHLHGPPGSPERAGGGDEEGAPDPRAQRGAQHDLHAALVRREEPGPVARAQPGDARCVNHGVASCDGEPHRGGVRDVAQDPLAGHVRQVVHPALGPDEEAQVVPAGSRSRGRPTSRGTPWRP